MLRSEFQVGLLRAEDATLRLGHRVETLVARAVEALLAHDAEAAAAVIAEDDAVDEETGQLQKDVHAMILLQAPVADDLRRLVSLVHVTRSIERIGDYAVNIARLTDKLPPGAPDVEDPALTEQVREMALRAQRTVQRGLDCYGRRQADGPATVGVLEEGVDLLKDGLTERLTAHARTGGDASTWAIAMVQATRHLERIGDHAVKLAEQGAWVATARWTS